MNVHCWPRVWWVSAHCACQTWTSAPNIHMALIIFVALSSHSSLPSPGLWCSSLQGCPWRSSTCPPRPGASGAERWVTRSHVPLLRGKPPSRAAVGRKRGPAQSRCTFFTASEIREGKMLCWTPPPHKPRVASRNLSVEIFHLCAWSRALVVGRTDG